MDGGESESWAVEVPARVTALQREWCGREGGGGGELEPAGMWGAGFQEGGGKVWSVTSGDDPGRESSIVWGRENLRGEVLDQVRSRVGLQWERRAKEMAAVPASHGKKGLAQESLTSP